MRGAAAVLLLLASLSPAAPAQKCRYGQEPPKAKPGVDYPIQMHIREVERRTHCDGSDSCDPMVYAHALLNGAKIELMGYWLWTRDTASAPLGVGDYQARMLKDAPKKSPNPLGREYELVFPDRTVWRGTVTGYSE